MSDLDESAFEPWKDEPDDEDAQLEEHLEQQLKQHIHDRYYATNPKFRTHYLNANKEWVPKPWIRGNA